MFKLAVSTSLALCIASCAFSPSQAGCNQFIQPVYQQQVQRVVKQQQAYIQNAVNYNQGLNNYNARFVAVEAPYVLQLIAERQRLEQQEQLFQGAVQQQSKGEIAGLKTAIEKISVEIARLGAARTSPNQPPITPPPPQAGPEIPVPPNPTQPGEEGIQVPEALISFYQAKCAECHTGKTAKGVGGKPFALFDDDGNIDLNVRKLVASDIYTYDNRMPPVNKLTAQERSEFRAGYQFFAPQILQYFRDVEAAQQQPEIIQQRQ